MKIEFTRVRGKKATARCNDLYKWNGLSPLNCECGCQTPHEEDLDYDLTGVTAEIKEGKDFFGKPFEPQLVRNGKKVGSVSFFLEDGKLAGGAVYLEGEEFLNVQPISPLFRLIKKAYQLTDNRHTKKEKIKEESAGSTLEETAAIETVNRQSRDARRNKLFKKADGWCQICKSFCYGDCEAN